MLKVTDEEIAAHNRACEVAAMKERQLKEYLERRQLVWCAAFGAAFVELRANHDASVSGAKAYAIEVADQAAAAMPGVPGEDEAIT